MSYEEMAEEAVELLRSIDATTKEILAQMGGSPVEPPIEPPIEPPVEPPPEPEEWDWQSDVVQVNGMDDKPVVVCPQHNAAILNLRFRPDDKHTTGRILSCIDGYDIFHIDGSIAVRVGASNQPYNAVTGHIVADNSGDYLQCTKAWKVGATNILELVNDASNRKLYLWLDGELIGECSYHNNHTSIVETFLGNSPKPNDRDRSTKGVYELRFKEIGYTEPPVEPPSDDYELVFEKNNAQHKKYDKEALKIGSGKYEFDVTPTNKPYGGRIASAGGPADALDVFLWHSNYSICLRLGRSQNLMFSNARVGRVENPNSPKDHWLECTKSISRNELNRLRIEVDNGTNRVKVYRDDALIGDADFNKDYKARSELWVMRDERGEKINGEADVRVYKA